VGDNSARNQFDEYTGRPFAEWPRVLQAVAIVTCLHGHDEALTDEFLSDEIARLGLMEMSVDKIREFRERHLLHDMD
jgi:hypothetical protein